MPGFDGCPELKGCKHGHRIDTHHLWWPRTLYQTALEKAFRQDPRNKRKICRCLHDLEHLKKPPKKPSVEYMRKFLG